MTAITSLANALFSLGAVYVLTGAVLWVFAAMTFRDRGNRRRVGSGLFWLILGTTFIFGGVLPHWVTGLLVLAMVAIDGLGRVARGTSPEPTPAEQRAEARRLGDKIFLPVLMIPAITFGCAATALTLKWFAGDVNRAALVGLGLSGIVAALVGMRLTGGTPQMTMEQGRRLNDAVGTVSILPQLLASLGVIFAAAKVGDLVAQGIQQIIPADNLFLLVLANCLGMALFTVVMGNSFAAFPVIAAGVLVPLIVRPFGVDPAMVGIITLTAGSSGTLMTPMAANFNIVPAVLLNMRDQYGVIKFQLPFALTIWTLHVVLMWLLIKLI
ncbi:MAG TPA: DUF979 domain-containing protein [Blastocatellia bacterium]|nr:DUF979 domain-containing protein [Blastocatellia bacterium]